ncbi:MAG: hypothetical protein LBN92_03325 [Treponema sp.]|nr:hypothetical protein [Treponema sp.]
MAHRQGAFKAPAGIISGIPAEFPGSLRSVFAVLARSRLRPAALRGVYLVARHFFGFQYKSSLFPGRVPVSWSDHPLDETIPFDPSWVTIYLSFIPFWVRMTGFLLIRRKREDRALEFINAIAGLYLDASSVYRKNLSTTRRPFYIKNPSFLLIHITDPHLMCVPSLHVMIVIRCYTRMREYAETPEAENASYREAVFRHALAITEAVLRVKQHGVNCVAAALFAMSALDRNFPREEAVRFTAALFDSRFGNGAALKQHVLALYGELLDAYTRSPSDGWAAPLLAFLEKLPQKQKSGA